METIVRPYEAVVIVHEKASLEAQKELFRKNQQIIKDHTGNVVSLETWGKKYLGNPIKKEKYAVFFHSIFTANTDAVAELERTMRINDNVLRFMHIKLEESIPAEKHVELFKESIIEAQKREKEREAKAAKRKTTRKPM